MPEASSPEDIPKIFESAWNARDAHTLASIFAEDADFVNVVGLWWHNRTDIERSHDYGLKKIFKDSELTARGVKIRKLGETVAIIHVRWKLTGQTAKSDEKLDQRNTVMMFVAERRNNKWRVVSAQNTDVIPGKETITITDGKAAAVDYRS